MGAWGPAIFSDDTACDVRTDYRELLEDGHDDNKAMRLVIAKYEHLNEDEAHILWLALAAAQTALGRLDAKVKDEALRIIDEGIGLELWVEAGSKALSSRKAVLTKLRASLTGPQKSPSKVRKPWAHVTDLVAGDVLAYRRPEGEHALLRVARLEEGRSGTAPILRQLDWDRSTLPTARTLRRLKTLPETRPMSGEPSTSYRVSRNKKKDPDWIESGFSRMARVDSTNDDATFAPRSYLDWKNLARNLDNRC